MTNVAHKNEHILRISFLLGDQKLEIKYVLINETVTFIWRRNEIGCSLSLNNYNCYFYLFFVDEKSVNDQPQKAAKI